MRVKSWSACSASSQRCRATIALTSHSGMPCRCPAWRCSSWRSTAASRSSQRLASLTGRPGHLTSAMPAYGCIGVLLSLQLGGPLLEELVHVWLELPDRLGCGFLAERHFVERRLDVLPLGLRPAGLHVGVVPALRVLEVLEAGLDVLVRVVFEDALVVRLLEALEGGE